MKDLMVGMLLTFALGAGTAAAQGPGDITRGSVMVGGALGAASGPTTAGVVDGFVGFRPVSSVGLKLLVEGWRSLGACTQMWPSSYACEAGGWSGRVGAEVSPIRIGMVAPFIEVNGGLHSRSGPGGEWTHEPVVGAGLGARFNVGDSWAVRVQSRQSWVFDGAYEELMGEKLRLSAFVVGIDYHLGRSRATP